MEALTVHAHCQLHLFLFRASGMCRQICSPQVPAPLRAIQRHRRLSVPAEDVYQDRQLQLEGPV